MYDLLAEWKVSSSCLYLCYYEENDELRVAAYDYSFNSETCKVV